MPTAMTSYPGRWDPTNTTCGNEDAVARVSEATRGTRHEGSRMSLPLIRATLLFRRIAQAITRHDFPECPRAKAGGWKALRSPTIILPNNNNDTDQMTSGGTDVSVDAGSHC